MIELIFILLQFFIIFFLTSFNLFLSLNKNSKITNLSFSENIAFNSVIFLNFILIISFFNVNLNTIIVCYFIFIVFLIIIYLSKFKTLFIFKNEDLIFSLLFFIASIVIFFEVANNLVIGWDAQKFWIYKMLNFYNGNSITNLSNLPNPYYPYLGSLVWSFFWKVSFLENEYSGRLFYVFIYLSSLLLLINNFRLSISYKIIFFILLIIISYDYTYQSHWSMFSGFQEILIFSLVSISMHFLYKLSNSKIELENFYISSILLICNLLVWTKHEGFIISSSLILILLFFFNFKIKKKINIFLIFLSIVFLRIFIFDFYNLNPSAIQHQGYDFNSYKDIFEKISFLRILIVLKSLILNLLTNYLALLGFLIFFIMLITKKKLKKINYAIFFLILNLSCFCAIYLVTSLDLTWMLKVGMDRIIYQLSPVFILFFLEFFNSKKYLKN